MTERLSWDEYFMNIAVQVSLRSTCIRRKVGALLVKDNKIISTGYNGSPTGIPNCSDDKTRCYRSAHNIPSGEKLDLCYAVHAEINAIMNAIKSGNDLTGAVVYVTTFPCSSCAKALIQAGIKKICYLDKYSNEFTLGMIREAGLECCEMDSSIYKTPDTPKAKRYNPDDLDVIDPIVKEIYYSGFEPGSDEFVRNRHDVFNKYGLYDKYGSEKVVVAKFNPAMEITSSSDAVYLLHQKIKNNLGADYRSNLEYNGGEFKQLVVATILHNPIRGEIALLKSITGRLKDKFTMIQGHVEYNNGIECSSHLYRPHVFNSIVNKNLRKEIEEEVGLLPCDYESSMKAFIQTNDNKISSEHLGLLFITTVADRAWDDLKSTEPEKHECVIIKEDDISKIILSDNSDTWLKKFLSVTIFNH